MDKNIEKLFGQMISLLGLNNLSRSEQERIVEELGKNMLQRIVVASHGKLSPEDTSTLNSLSEKGDTAAIYTLLTEKISNFKELSYNAAQEVLSEFKEEFNKK